MRCLAVVMTVTLLGCAADENAALDWALMDDADHLEREPPVYGGCGDVFLYAKSESDRMGMTISTYSLEYSLIEEAREAGGSIETVFELPAEGIDIVLQAGRNLSRYWCNDAIYPPLPVVRLEAFPVGGTLTLQVSSDPDMPSSWYTPGTATAILEDVVWATEGGVLVDSLPAEIEMYDVFVGWLAG